MFAIGNDEVEGSPSLGKSIKCNLCGKKHKIQYGDKVLENGDKVECKMLAFVKCGESSYLVGINGKDIRKAKGL